MERRIPNEGAIKSSVIKKIYPDFKRLKEPYEMLLAIHKRMQMFDPIETRIGVGGSVIGYLPGSDRGSTPLIVSTDIKLSERDRPNNAEHVGMYDANSIASTAIILETTKFLVDKDIKHAPMIILFKSADNLNTDHNGVRTLDYEHAFSGAKIARNAIVYVPGGIPGEVTFNPKALGEDGQSIVNVYKKVIEDRSGIFMSKKNDQNMNHSEFSQNGLDTLAVSTGVNSQWGPYRIDISAIQMLSADLISVVEKLS